MKGSVCVRSKAWFSAVVLERWTGEISVIKSGETKISGEIVFAQNFSQNSGSSSVIGL